jgi:hypothetical protein
MFGHRHAHAGQQSHIPGVTHDTILRPVGVVLTLFGATWALFAHIAVAAGTLDVPKAAGALIAAGLLMTVIGKAEQQI